MFILKYNEQLRLCRFSESEYALVIATVRPDGSIDSVRETGLVTDGVQQRDADLAAEDILLAFAKPAIASKRK